MKGTIVKRENFELLGKEVLGRIQFHPPFKAAEQLSNEARFVYVMNGKSKLYVPNNQLEINSGDSFLMKCECFMNQWEDLESPEPTEVVVFRIYPEILSFAYEDKIPEFFTKVTDVNPDPVEKIESNVIIESFIQSFRYYFDHPGMVNDELLRVKIKELMLILMNSDKTGRIRAILGDFFRSNEYEFKEIIHTHLYEDLHVEDLAFFAGLSLSSFKRKFKAVFGTSPKQYINSKRLDRAQNLLRTTTQRVSEVAYDCGFNDVAYFSKAFSSAYEMSPTDFRKTYLDQ